MTATNPPDSLYDQVGGMPFFAALVDRFYDGVEGDDLLRPMYPPDLEPGKEALALFLAQYWGGPTTYSDNKGHPRLRMRHAPFVIGDLERDRWQHHMTEAVRTSGADHACQRQLLDYFEMAANHMVNTR